MDAIGKVARNYTNSGHRQEDARLVVHGDDLWLLGDEDALAKLLPALHDTYELKVDGILGPELEDARTVRSLNKQIRLVPVGGGDEEEE